MGEIQFPIFAYFLTWQSPIFITVVFCTFFFFLNSAGKGYFFIYSVEVTNKGNDIV